ncbi:MAG: YciI family protein [Acidimicrobiales bacterium]
MTQYLLSVHNVDGASARSAEDTAAIQAAVGEVNAQLRAAGAWVFAGGLHPPYTATVVRADDQGDVIMTDGPFLEGKEHIGGVWVIEAPDLDAALAWAERAAAACQQPVEVRPFQDIPPQASGR